MDFLILYADNMNPVFDGSYHHLERLFKWLFQILGH